MSQSSSTVNNGLSREEPGAAAGSFKKRRKNQSPERHIEIGNKLKNMVNQGSGGVQPAPQVKLEEVNFEQ